MIQLDDSLRSAQAQAFVSALSGGFLQLKGPLGTFAQVGLPLGTFSSPVGGVTSLVGQLSLTSLLTGEITFFELRRANMSLVATGTVGKLGTSGDLRLTRTKVYQNNAFLITAFTYVVPA